MGTLVNGLTDIFRIILKAAAAIPGRQLVLSIGSNIQMDDIGPIPASAIVVPKAPQIELLKRAEAGLRIIRVLEDGLRDLRALANDARESMRAA